MLGSSLLSNTMTGRTFIVLNVFVVALAAPTFPDGTAAALGSIGDKVPAGPDDSENVAKLVGDSKTSLEATLVAQMSSANLAKAAYARVKQSVVKYKFVGGCARDFTGCPKGWVASGGACAPPSDYDGLCGSISGFTE